MSLTLVATPIGHIKDITLRAIESLQEADVVIGEEFREVSTLLKRLEIVGKKMEVLNEHSKDEDVAALADLCAQSKVALVTDCGTPGFCDPGARLVAVCRKKGIAVTTNPGASSLMCLLSLAGDNIKQFVFRGFLPAEREERQRALIEISRETQAVVLMDTPYRLKKLVGELAGTMPGRQALLALDLTQPTEEILEGSLQEIAGKVQDRKAEFMLLLYSSCTRSASTGSFTTRSASTGSSDARSNSRAGARRTDSHSNSQSNSPSNSQTQSKPVASGRDASQRDSRGQANTKHGLATQHQRKFKKHK